MVAKLEIHPKTSVSTGISFNSLFRKDSEIVPVHPRTVPAATEPKQTKNQRKKNKY